MVAVAVQALLPYTDEKRKSAFLWGSELILVRLAHKSTHPFTQR
jgi:hypothetical protein